MENQAISKNYSNMLMQQQLLRLIYYYHLACSLLILSYIQKIYLLFSVIYSLISIIIFILTLIYFISIIILQTFWCHRIVATKFQQVIHWHNNIKILCIVYKYVIEQRIFKVNFLILFLASLSHSTGISLLQQYMQHYNHKNLILPWKL